jgi:hypothetical protein
MMGTGSDFWGKVAQQQQQAQQGGQGFASSLTGGMATAQPSTGGYGSPLAAPAAGMQYDRLGADPRAQLLQAMLMRAQSGQPGMAAPAQAATTGAGGM